MTEPEWLACDDPDQLLLQEHPRSTRRRLLLFAVACCRALRWRFVDPRSWAAVEAAEAHADGALTTDELRPIAAGAEQSWSDAALRRDTQAPRNMKANGHTALAAWYLVRSLVADAEGDTRNGVGSAIGSVRQGVKKVKPVQSRLFVDLFGNPFRPVSFDPDWRTSAAVALASQMYESRDFSPLPILADALQDADCDNSDILNHCRSEGTHVRGCWVVDLVLNKW